MNVDGAELEYTTHLPFPRSEVFRWHERPGAFERLTPPWSRVTLERDGSGVRDGARVTLRVRAGPIQFDWALRHLDYREGERFCDEQTSGPFRAWRHEHRFADHADGGTSLEDLIRYSPPLGAAGRAFVPSIVNRELERLFAFRHRRLANDLSRHAAWQDRPRMTVAVSGASGLVGSALTHFLTTGGHTVVPMIRRGEGGGGPVIRWDPEAGRIDAAALSEVDAVVNLAGEPMAPGRWTAARKKSIYRSRVRGTGLIAGAMAAMPDGPRTLVSASAVGYYGDRGDQRLVETDSGGRGFLSEVCQAWEGATAAAEKAGVRTVHLRTGVVLTPAGGALGQMLTPFLAGVGGRIGSGAQYLSWIDLDDLLGLILHSLYTTGVEGPLNATAPNPVTNSTFTSALGRVLRRPTVFPLPALAVRAAFGEMGREALLEGQRVIPRRAMDSGFVFHFEGVEESLRFQLGRMTT
ncbi:MAG: TIGR01777 family oxidoreductase [Gemmatimonadota bacterium]|nr:TIGR01777 family oxidoreductase [Gemmatimonadota bacterium]